MLSTILNTIDSLDNYPDFGEFYQDYIKELEDDIIENELTVNEKKLVRVKSFNSVIIQLNDLTEELKLL